MNDAFENLPGLLRPGSQLRRQKALAGALAAKADANAAKARIFSLLIGVSPDVFPQRLFLIGSGRQMRWRGVS